jgi:glycerophosphoryl diester phosphodiesterase
MQKLQRYLIDGVAYTVDDVETLKNLQKLWVKFIMTDDFEKLKNAL